MSKQRLENRPVFDMHFLFVKMGISVVFFLNIQYDKEDNEQREMPFGTLWKSGRICPEKGRPDISINKGGKRMKVYRPEELLEQQVRIVVPVYENAALPAWVDALISGKKISHLNLDYGKEYHILTETEAEIVLLGMGKEEEISRRKIREAAGSAARSLKDRPLYLAAAEAACGELTEKEAAYEMAYGAVYGSYEFVKIHANAKEEQLIGLAGDETEIGQAAEEAEQAAFCVNHARNLGNMPSNYMTPEVLAEEAEKLAKELGVSCEILTNQELKELGAGALLGVNRGAFHGARLITLRYQGNGDEPYTAFVGKGLTFDAGGYNLKTAAGMRGMKYDMCGGANVLAAFEWVVRQKAKANVMAVIAATENKIGPDAYTCDEVLVSMSGKTIEVTNTDAEGRLILCDALTYAQKQGAKRLIDMATLTGACVTALGKRYTGVFTNAKEFLSQLEQAAQRADEKVWELPVDEEFHKLIRKSSVADMVNAIPGEGGGSSLAAAFLEEFIEEGNEWIHLDIAGPGDITSDTSYAAGGATGVMVRTLGEMFSGKE